MSQIFKEKIPDTILFELLNKLCIKNNNYYIFNFESYKKGLYTESIQQFVEICKLYYYNSKKKYLEKKQTYNSFVTILRQICKHNKLTYLSKLVYNKSDYNIDFYIFTS
jgi:hypothetical protein